MARLLYGGKSKASASLLAVICAVAVGSRGDAQTRPASLVRSKLLVPGVLKVVPATPEPGDTHSGPRELLEIAQDGQIPDWQPNFAPKSHTLKEQAKRAIIRRSVWQLEFGFKPVRMIQAEGGGGPIWYMLYYVQNRGNHVKPVAKVDEFGDPSYTLQPWNPTVRFVPNFILQSHDLKKAYLDRPIPDAVRRIAQRELRNKRLYNSGEMARLALRPDSEKVWGVATWSNVDPRTNFFSVYVQGLTNAYRWPSGTAPQPGDSPLGSDRRLLAKTLQINFYRPGDAHDSHENEIYYGPPRDEDPRRQQQYLSIYRLEEPLEYLWVYR